MGSDVISVRAVLDTIDDLWSPVIVARHNDTELRAAKFYGEYIWHVHEQTDELFMVVAGRLRIMLRPEAGDETFVELGVGEVFVVPAGTMHKPLTFEPTSVLMLEAAGTLTTGDRNDGVPGHIPSTAGREGRTRP